MPTTEAQATALTGSLQNYSYSPQESLEAIRELIQTAERCDTAGDKRGAILAYSCLTLHFEAMDAVATTTKAVPDDWK